MYFQDNLSDINHGKLKAAFADSPIVTVRINILLLVKTSRGLLSHRL